MSERGCRAMVARVAGALWVGALFAMSVASPATAQVETFEYTVEEGDTCESIAEEFYGHVGGCDLIDKYNADDGKQPDLTPGNVLELPTRVARAEALVDQKHGSVRAREPERSWRPAEIGDELYRSWRVNTLERARAQLNFRNASRLKMREETLVIIYGGDREETERRYTRARLQNGTLRSKLDELAGGGGMQIDSPSARAELGIGESLFEVDEAETTRVANHGGEPIEVSGKGSASDESVSVGENKGTKVEKGEPPSPPQKLPPSPTWQGEPTSVLAFGGEQRTIRASWETVEEAEEYFVELTADRRGVEVVKSAYVSADVTSLEVRELPTGSYFATVSSIDGDGFEGVPSERLAIRVVSVDYEEAQRLDEGDSAPRFALGTRLAAPGEMNCALGDGAPKPTVRLRSPGEYEFRCRSSDGRWTRRRAIEVARPKLELDGRDVSADGAVVFRRGEFGIVELAFSPSVPPDVEFMFREADERVLRASPTPTGRRRLRVKIEASDGAPERATMVARSSDGTELVTVPVRLESPSRGMSDDLEELPSPFDRALRVGPVGGLYGRFDTVDETSEYGIGGGLVVSYLATPHFALEAEPRVLRFPESGWQYGSGLRAVFSAPLDSVEPHLGVGFGVYSASSDWRPVLGATAGADWWLNGDWGVRTRLGANVGFSDGDAIWLPRLQAGVLYQWP